MSRVLYADWRTLLSKSLGFTFSDTAFGSPATLNLTRANLNFGVDFAEKERVQGESVIVNINSSNDCPEKIRISYQEVKDIYKGSNIDSGHYAPSRKGFSLVSQLTEVARVTESVTGEIYDLPISCHLVIKAPNDALVTATVIETLLKRLLSSLYGENVVTTTRLAQLMKGAVTPPEL